MSINEAALILSEHHRWRLGDDEIKATDPVGLSAAIDVILSDLVERRLSEDHVNVVWSNVVYAREMVGWR